MTLPAACRAIVHHAKRLVRHIHVALDRAALPDPARDPWAEADVPHTSTYAEIKAHLSDVVPCYGKQAGCWMDDKIDCNEGCRLLAIYSIGYRAAISAAALPAPRTGERGMSEDATPDPVEAYQNQLVRWLRYPRTRSHNQRGELRGNDERN